MTVIEAVRGDLTEQQVDVVVNAANSSLLGGGGVDGAIHRRGGPSILEACQEIRRTTWPQGLPVGEAVSTGGGDLHARWVVHTVGPQYGREAGHEQKLLASCHTRSLEEAHHLGARTVAFPAVSCGVYGYPVDEAAPVAVRAVMRYVAAHPDAFDEIRFVLNGEQTDAGFRTAIAALAHDAPTT